MHTRRDLLRAVMEGVTYSLRDCVEILRGMGVEFGEMLACGGGEVPPCGARCWQTPSNAR